VHDEPLRFAGNLNAMYVSRLDEKTGTILPLDAWSKIKTNATNFHNKFIPGVPKKTSSIRSRGSCLIYAFAASAECMRSVSVNGFPVDIVYKCR
jgi:hypothetical protein